MWIQVLPFVDFGDSPNEGCTMSGSQQPTVSYSFGQGPGHPFVTGRLALPATAVSINLPQGSIQWRFTIQGFAQRAGSFNNGSDQTIMTFVPNGNRFAKVIVSS
jgi:hypothetical protein